MNSEMLYLFYGGINIRQLKLEIDLIYFTKMISPLTEWFQGMFDTIINFTSSNPCLIYFVIIDLFTDIT